MALIPNIDYTFLNSSTLVPLTLITGGSKQMYYYQFDDICTGATATTSVSICNLSTSGITFINTYSVGSEFDLPNISGVTIPQYDCYKFDIGFHPTTNGIYTGVWTGETTLGNIILSVLGTGVNEFLNYVDNSCFLDFGSQIVNSITSQTKNIDCLNLNGLTISFSGDPGDFEFTNPITLSYGLNDINFTFNPQYPYGDKTKTLIIQGDCYDHPITLCGGCSFGEGLGLSVDVSSAFVGCCNDVTLYISNNFVYGNNNPITIIDIDYPTYLTIENQSIPFIINKGDCDDIKFEFCPDQSGYTSTSIGIEYTYEIDGISYTGDSKIDFTLSAFTHPFTFISSDCINFTCANTTYVGVIPITNYGNQPFEVNYYFDPNYGYDFDKVFNIADPPLIIPPGSTSNLNISINTNELTTGSSFCTSFYLNLVDVDCCIDKKKCVNVAFCPTKIFPDYGYPKNVTCYGECNGEMSVTIQNCGDECITSVLWSSNTNTSLVTEFDDCVLLFENETCIGEEAGFWINSFTGISTNHLPAGDYLIQVSGGCCDFTSYFFTITQPDPLFVEINWVNPRNYCKNDIPQLCGIVPSPDVNPSGYVVIDKETLITVVNNDIHDIPGQVKRGYQQYDSRENEIAHGNKVSSINSFRNYILNFFSGTFEKYKNKMTKEELFTVKSWDDIVAETIGDGCCFASFVSGGTAPYSYQWYGPNNYTSNSPNIFDRPCCEPYILVVTDAHGCTTSATSTCLNCSFEIITLSASNPTCTYSNNGFIDVAVSGNCTSVFHISLESNTYEFSYTGNSITFTGLSEGNYVLSVGDFIGECYLKPIEINLTPRYQFNINTDITGTTCLQSCNGRMNVVVDVIANEDNISNTFMYNLDGNIQRDPTFTGICSGNHTLVVINTVNYCELSININVPNLSLFNVETDVIDASSKDSSDGSITIIVTNGSSLCDYYECYNLSGDTFGGLVQFTNGTYTISNLKPGTYNFILSDNNGCLKIFKVKVGYIKFKPIKGDLFEHKRSDVYGGSKIISNTPKGQ
jgi:hypothetical protein